jgi:sec-independent protein translocase protein TatC
MKGDLEDLARRRGEMPFLDHLEELRWRILWSLLSIVIGTVVGFLLIRYFDVLELLIKPIRAAIPDNPDFRLIYLSPADPFFITLKLSVVVGIILAFPIIVYQVWSFLAPALENHEKRAIIPALYLGLMLFCAGVALAYFVALPVSIVFFQTFEGGLMEAQYEIGKTLALITKILLGFGIIFELPVVVMILSALGLVTPEFLRSKRRHAIVAITVAASFLTPGDVITLTIMLMVPLFFLYEFSIYLSRLIWRRKRAREREEEAQRDQEASDQTEEEGEQEREPSGGPHGEEDRSREIRETPPTPPEAEAESGREDSGSAPDSEGGP